MSGDSRGIGVGEESTFPQAKALLLRSSWRDAGARFWSRVGGFLALDSPLGILISMTDNNSTQTYGQLFSFFPYFDATKTEGVWIGFIREGEGRGFGRGK